MCGDIAADAVVLVPRDDSGVQFRAEELRAVQVKERTVKELGRTRSGCIMLNTETKDADYLVISAKRSGQVWGMIHSQVPDSTEAEVRLSPLPNFEIGMTCPKEKATRQTIQAPLTNTKALDTRYFRLVAQVGQTSYRGLVRTESDASQTAEFDLDGIKEGPYDLNLSLFDLTQNADATRQSIHCPMLIDRTPPRISVDFGVSKPGSQILVGAEKILFKSDEATRFHYCWRELAQANQSCEFQSGRTEISAPLSGEWVLNVYGVDEAGNRSVLEHMPILISSKSELDAIRGEFAVANFQIDQGLTLKGLGGFIEAEKRRRRLPTAKEREVLQGHARDTFRKAAYAQGPTNQIDIQGELSGMAFNPQGSSFLTYSREQRVQVWSLKGELVFPTQVGDYAEWDETGKLLAIRDGQYLQTPTSVTILTEHGARVAALGRAEGLSASGSSEGKDHPVHFINKRSEICIPVYKGILIYDYQKMTSRTIPLDGWLVKYVVSPTGQEILVLTSTDSGHKLMRYRVKDLVATPVDLDFGSITSLAYSDDGTYAAIVDSSRARVIDQNNKLVVSTDAAIPAASATFFTYAGKKALHIQSGNQDTLMIDLQGKVLGRQLVGRNQSPLVPLTHFSFLGVSDDTLYQFNPDHGYFEWTSMPPGSRLLAAHPSSPFILIGYTSGRVTLWNRDTFTQYTSDLVHGINLPYGRLRFSLDSEHLLHAQISSVGVWKVSGEKILDFDLQNGDIIPEGSMAHYDAGNGRLQFLSKRSTQQKQTQTVHILESTGITSQQSFDDAAVCLSPASMDFAVLQGSSIRLFQDGQVIREFESQIAKDPRELTFFNYSEDGRFLIASASSGNTAVWTKDGTFLYATPVAAQGVKLSSQADIMATLSSGIFRTFEKGELIKATQGEFVDSFNIFDLMQDGGKLAVLTNKGVEIHDLVHRQEPMTFFEERSAKGILSVQIQGDLLAVSHPMSRLVNVYSERGELIIKIDEFAPLSLFSPDNRYVLAGNKLIDLNETKVRHSYCKRMQDYLEKTYNPADRAIVCPASAE